MFFFQAEDGIRDLTVTGVQTCALPILVAALPVKAKAQTWGEEVYFEVPVKATLESGAKQVVSPGTVCLDRKSTRLNSSHSQISYAVFCLKKKKNSRY